MSRKDRLNEVFSTQLSPSGAERLPAGNPTPAKAGKPAPFGLNKYAAQHLKQPNARYIQEIDPDLITHSGPLDRMGDPDPSADQTLRDSISKTGQTTPVFLRPDPDTPGRFLIIYGRRRVRALKTLGQKVKAVIRDDVSDEEAVIIQGQENSVRQDLSFFERARFLVAIEAEGFPRAVAIDALAIDKSRASNYAKVGTAVSDPVAQLIGPAPGIGRDRWLAFAETCMARADAEDRIVTALMNVNPVETDSDTRFLMALKAVQQTPRTATPKAQTLREIGVDGIDGQIVFATVKTTKSGVSVALPDRGPAQSAFAAHMKTRIEDLIREELARWQKTSGISEK